MVKYPAREWSVVGAKRPSRRSNLIVCADVIEHVLDLDAFICYVNEWGNKYLLFSTPDRNLVYFSLDPHRYGPPANPSHVREWSFEEFNKYMSLHYKVLDHFISNKEQGTQVAFCASQGADGDERR